MAPVVSVGCVVGDVDCDGVDDGVADPVGDGDVAAGDGDVEVADTVGDGDEDGDCLGLAVEDADGHPVGEDVANGARAVGIAVGARFPDPGVAEGFELNPPDTYWIDPELGRAVG